MNTNHHCFFSVIIPCYNSMNFICRGIKSLERQLFTDFEVIFIDDCSSDNTYEFLCHLSTSSNLNITVFRNEKNSGPGVSRNKGITNSNGEYITFMDSDDWYEDNLLLSLHDKILNNNSDLVFFDFYRSYGDNYKKSISCTQSLKSKIDKESIIALCYDSLCTLCVKKEIFNHIKLPPIYNAEDVVTVPILVYYASEISILDKPLYNYLYRLNSLSSSNNKKIAYSFLDAYSFLENSIAKSYKEAIEYKGVVVVLYGCVFKSLQAGMPKQEIVAYIDRFMYMYPNCLSNRYLDLIPLRKKIFLLLVKYRCFNLLNIYIWLQVFMLKLPLYLYGIKSKYLA